MKIKGKPADFARKAMQEFNDKAYHSPQDEMQPDWDFSGFAVLARFALDVARDGGQRRPPADVEPRRRIPPGPREERGEVGRGR